MLSDVKSNEPPPPATPAQDCFCSGACAQPDVWVPMVPAQTGSGPGCFVPFCRLNLQHRLSHQHRALQSPCLFWPPPVADLEPHILPSGWEQGTPHTTVADARIPFAPVARTTVHVLGCRSAMAPAGYQVPAKAHFVFVLKISMTEMLMIALN